MSRFTRYARPTFILIASATSLITLPKPGTYAETWNVATGGSWNQTTNWNPATIPNSIGATAIFNGDATLLNPAQTANRTINLDGAQTVGSIIFNTDLSTFTNTLAAGTGGSLIFDETGAGPATVTTTGGGTGNNTISAPITLTDSLRAIVNNTTATSGAGSLNLTGPISGPGGFIKEGDGAATFGLGTGNAGIKTYTGATVLSGGRMRISSGAAPTASSSFTVNDGAQLTPITDGTYSLGSGTLYLNGYGAASGPYAAFPGAIRQDTDKTITIANPVVLQSDTLIHVQGSVTGSLTFTSSVSGPGSLIYTAFAHNEKLGKLVLQGANTYSGGTLVNGGTIQVSGPAASLGTGDVTVVSSNAVFATASARITIETGVLDAIANTATLSLAGGNAFGVADDGFIELQSGVNEIVGALVLGGVPQGFGTYGSTASQATFKSDEFFSGPGIVTVVPEPGTTAMLLVGLGAFAMRRRRS